MKDPSSLRSSGLKLRKNAQIVLEQRPDIRNVELDHGAAIQPQSEGEAAPLLGIDADVAQHLRMDHPAAEDLHPAGLRTGAAARAFAVEARHVDFRGWCGEREEARGHAHLQLLAEEALDEVLERSAQVSEVDAFVD